MIVLVTGCPCSGKTSVCRELEAYGFRAVSVDRFFEPGRSKYDPANSEKAYARMFASLGGGDVAVEAPGNAAAFLRHKRGLPYYTTVLVTAPWDMVLERYQSRWQQGDIPPQMLRKEYEDAKRLAADFTIDTSRTTPAQAAEKIHRFLETHEHSTIRIAREFARGARRLRTRDPLDAAMEGLDE